MKHSVKNQEQSIVSRERLLSFKKITIMQMSGGEETLNIVILGLENAGKTTLARTMVGKEFIETMTTIGMNIEIIDYKGYKVQIIDLGGQITFRETLWGYYATLAKGVIFVFDMFDKDKTKEALRWFKYVSSWISEKATMMFLANKIDLKETNDQYMKLGDIIKKFELDKISRFPKRTFRIFEVSAKTGENVDHSIKWLLQRITEETKEDTRISFAIIVDNKNKVTYSNMIEEEESDIDMGSILENIEKLKETRGLESYSRIGEYNIIIRNENQFSVIVGTKFEISERNLQTAANSLSTIIQEEYFPPAKYKDQLDGIINYVLLQGLPTE
jgi:small GTP-binding protein